MLSVDVDALEFLAARLEDGELGEGVGLRLVTDGAGYELVPDHGRSHDRVFDVEGRPVLFVDPKISERVDGRVLEIESGTLKLGWTKKED